MPGAKQPQPESLAGTLKDVGKALAQAHRIELLSLEKKRCLPKTALKQTDHATAILFYCSVNAILSAALIAFNKHLMHADRFPYPVPLVIIHASASSIFVGAFFLFLRGCSKEAMSDSGYFSALPQALTEPSLKTKLFGLAALCAGQLACSNAAYLFASVIFIQLMKEGNLAIVYVLSVIAALEAFQWQRARVLLFVVFATLITLKGEVHFTWFGFAIQLTGQAFECLRIILTAMVLNAKGLNLDVLTYMLLVMPIMVLILTASVIFNSCVLQTSAIAIPSLQIIIAWGPQLLANAMLAVALNFSTAFVLKHASAVGLVLSGIMKDSAIVIVGAYFLHESITGIQVAGFMLQILGILVYSLIKLYPDIFHDGIFIGFKRILGMEDSVPIPMEKPCYGAAREDCH